MSYDDIISRHLTGQPRRDRHSSSSSNSSRTRRRSRHRQSSHKRRSRSRSRSRERYNKRRRYNDNHRDHSRDRPRRHGDRYHNHQRDKHHRNDRHRYNNSEREDRVSQTSSQTVTGEEIDEKTFAKKVEQELAAKNEQIKKQKLAKNKAANKRKERLKRLQKLKAQKKSKTASTKQASPESVTDTTVDSINDIKNPTNGYQDILPQQNELNHTDNIQTTSTSHHQNENYDEMQDHDASMCNDNNNNDIFSKDDKAMIIDTAQSAQGKAENMNLSHNWDDSEGYYVVVPGDIIKDKYMVMGTSGKGVYSTVLRVEEIKNKNKEYVIKVIRNNEHMKKQGKREIDFLREMKLRDPSNHHNCIILYESFWFRNHLCLLFEGMKCDLRRLLKSINISHSGLSINAVFQYTKQLLRALELLRSLNMIHADIKPDNVLVTYDFKKVKLCDFGSSFKSDEVEITPTVGSRYYRAPEIMIGIKWGYECDMWSLACTLFEIYSTNFLFKGKDNNEMLKNILDLCGLPPLSGNNKLSNTNYANGMFYAEHFNESGDFLESKYDAVSSFDIQIPHKLVNKANNMNQILLDKLNDIGNGQINVRLSYHDKIKLNEFANLLAKMLNLNVNKRITPKQALKHPFCVNPIVKQKANGKKKT